MTLAVTSFGLPKVGLPSSKISALAVSFVMLPFLLILEYGGSLRTTYLVPRCSNSSSTQGLASVRSLRSISALLRSPLVSP